MGGREIPQMNVISRIYNYDMTLYTSNNELIISVLHNALIRNNLPFLGFLYPKQLLTYRIMVSTIEYQPLNKKNPKNNACNNQSILESLTHWVDVGVKNSLKVGPLKLHPLAPNHSGTTSVTAISAVPQPAGYN